MQEHWLQQIALSMLFSLGPSCAPRMIQAGSAHCVDGLNSSKELLLGIALPTNFSHACLILSLHTSQSAHHGVEIPQVRRRSP